MEREQTLEAKKNYDNRFEMIDWPELRQFLTHLSGSSDASTFGANPLVSNRNNFKGEGDYERKDRITARVTSVTKGDVMALVKFDVIPPAEMASVLTVESVEHLGLAPGDEVSLVVKAVHVLPVKE
mgnify:CR=1 FL=1